MTNEELVAFEREIGDLFNAGKIKAPIHLYDGNEQYMQMVFKKIDVKKDWVCATWRNHYQCLLKGVPPAVLKERILAGKSMVMNLPQHRIVCSSIVGGIPSIAVGLAAASKGEKVWCWVGDMSAETGAFHEAYKYAVNHELPITFIVENNHLSVTTPTDKIWGRGAPWYFDGEFAYNKEDGLEYWTLPNMIYYEYTNNKYPHAGAGVRVQF
jgi:pyruvate dehydrogenase E1 component alpha subunit